MELVVRYYYYYYYYYIIIIYMNFMNYCINIIHIKLLMYNVYFLFIYNDVLFYYRKKIVGKVLLLKRVHKQNVIKCHNINK